MSARADSLARLLERGRQQEQKQHQQQHPNFLSASEAERMVKSLRPAAIHEFGTPAFLELHHTVEQLALQAHHNAATHSHEFVADLLCSHQGRLGALVKGLLAAEAWRECVFEPHLRKGGLLEKQINDDDDDNSTTTDPWVLYCALRHEAALASLLELCLFRAETPLSLLLSDSEALELADWCVRRLRHLALLAPMANGSTTTTTTTTLAHPIARVGAWRRELMARAAAAEEGDADDNPDDDKQQERRVRALAAAARALLDAPPHLELDERVVETEFQAALPALGLTRWLADAACCGGGDGGDNASPNSLALLSRLVGRPSAAKGDDAVTLLAQLLDRPPWERGAVSAGGGGGVERYCCGGGGDNGDSLSSWSSSWTPVAASERHRLAPQAAQAWLALCRLLCDPAARARWLAGGACSSSSSSSSVAAVLRLRRPLASPLLLDQAPFLVSLARVVEGLAMMANGSSGNNNGFASALSSSSSSSSAMMAMMVEPLPGLRDAILAEAAKRATTGGGNGGKDWARAIAEAQARGAFSAAQSREAAQARAASVARAFEHYCLLAGGGGGGEGEGDDTAAPADAAAAADASSSSAAKTTTPTSAHVTCWRQAGCDLWEPWGDFVCRVDAKKKGEVAVGGAGRSSASSSSPPPTRGVRRRLLPLDATARPFPCEGKVAVRVGDRVAEARLSLPALHGCREDDEGGDNNASSPPAVVWVSVGDLARDGFVLQLRLARVPPAKRERDRASGHWYGYAPGAGSSAGALTMKATAPTGE